MADARPTSFCRSDIRSAKQKQFSRPMTGHTPQKLPSFDAISCIIAVRAQNVPTRARLSYHYYPYLSRIFFKKFQDFLDDFNLFWGIQANKTLAGNIPPGFRYCSYRLPPGGSCRRRRLRESAMVIVLFAGSLRHGFAVPPPSRREALTTASIYSHTPRKFILI